MKLIDAINEAQKIQREKLLKGEWCDVECDCDVTKPVLKKTGPPVDRIIVYGYNQNPTIEFEIDGEG